MWPRRTASSPPPAASQMRTVSSTLAEATIVPSGLYSTSQTPKVLLILWVPSSSSSVPEATSQRRIFPSVPPETSRFPSRLKSTPPVWGRCFKIAISAIVDSCHSRILPSRLPEAIIFPSGWKAMDIIGAVWPNRISRFVSWLAFSTDMGGREDRSLGGIGDPTGFDVVVDVNVGMGEGLVDGDDWQPTNKTNNATNSQDSFLISLLLTFILTTGMIFLMSMVKQSYLRYTPAQPVPSFWSDL